MAHYYRVWCEQGSLDLHVASEAQAAKEAWGRNLGAVLMVRRRKAWRATLPRDYAVSLLRRIGSHAEAGKSLSEAFLLETQAETKRRYRAALEPAAEAVRRGMPLADALAAAGLFDETTRRMLDVAERSGSPLEILETVIERQEASAQTAKMLNGFALHYLFSYLMALSVAFPFRSQLLPMFREKAAGQPDALHWLDLIAAGVDSYIVLVLAMGVALAAVLALLEFGGHGAKSWSDRVLRKIPGAQSMFHYPALADTLLTASWSIRAGLRLDTALGLARDASSLWSVRELWQQARIRVERGVSLRAAMDTGILTHRELQEVGAYQNTRQLAGMFRKFARERVQDAQVYSKRAVWGYVAVLNGGIFALIAAGFATVFIAGQVDSTQLEQAAKMLGMTN